MHLKDSIVKNLCLLFKQDPEFRIDPLNGSMEDWIKEAKNAKHWKQLTICLLDPTSSLPDRSTDWNRRRTSGRQRTHTNNTSNNSAPPSPPPSPQQRQRSRVPPRQRRKQQSDANISGRPYDPEIVVHSFRRL